MPNFKLNPLVCRSLPVSSKEIGLFITLTSFTGAVKTYELTGVHFLFKLVAVIKLICYLS